MLQTFKSHKDTVDAIAFSPDGKLLASASNNHTVMLWDPATGATMQTLKGHRHTVSSLAFSSSGNMFAMFE